MYKCIKIFFKKRRNDPTEKKHADKYCFIYHSSNTSISQHFYRGAIRFSDVNFKFLKLQKRSNKFFTRTILSKLFPLVLKKNLFCFFTVFVKAGNTIISVFYHGFVFKMHSHVRHEHGHLSRQCNDSETRSSEIWFFVLRRSPSTELPAF